MWYVLIIGFLIIGAFLGFKFVGNNAESEQHINKSRLIENFTQNLNDTIKGMFSKKQIDHKLKYLAESQVPENLSFGAMCYEMVAVESTVHEYICPVCGVKTIYKKSKDKDKYGYIDGKLWEIDACRREIEKVNGINIKLDEKEFCSLCSPKINEPNFFLLVNIAGQKDTVKISNFTYMDIRLLHEFLDNQLVHKLDNDGETPLIDSIARIKELLGIK